MQQKNQLRSQSHRETQSLFDDDLAQDGRPKTAAVLGESSSARPMQSFPTEEQPRSITLFERRGDADHAPRRTSARKRRFRPRTISSYVIALFCVCTCMRSLDSLADMRMCSKCRGALVKKTPVLPSRARPGLTSLRELTVSASFPAVSVFDSCPSLINKYCPGDLSDE